MSTADAHAALRETVHILVRLNTEADALEQQLKDTKAKARHISEVVIPEMLEELGVSKMTLTTGETVSTKLDVAANIPAECTEAAYSWLDSHGLGDIIKTGVTLNYPRDCRAEAMAMANQLTQSDTAAQVTISEKVHPMTLKATIKELLGNGVDVPMELFGAREYYKTVVKLPDSNKV